MTKNINTMEPEQVSSAPTAQNVETRETHPDYAYVLHTEGKHRVAVCGDSIQYLLQRRINKAAGPEWNTRHFCTSANAAIREWQTMLRPEQGEPVARAILNLPKYARHALELLRAEVESTNTFLGVEPPNWYKHLSTHG